MIKYYIEYNNTPNLTDIFNTLSIRFINHILNYLLIIFNHGAAQYIQITYKYNTVTKQKDNPSEYSTSIQNSPYFKQV